MAGACTNDHLFFRSGPYRFRFQVSREDIPVTSRLRLGIRWDTDLEYSFSTRLILTKYFSVGINFDSDMKFGAGLVLHY